MYAKYLDYPIKFLMLIESENSMFVNITIKFTINNSNTH